jgi:hypothetical protein
MVARGLLGCGFVNADSRRRRWPQASVYKATSQQRQSTVALDGLLFSNQRQPRWIAQCLFGTQFAGVWYPRFARATAWRRARVENERLAAQPWMSLLILRRPCAAWQCRGAAIGRQSARSVLGVPGKLDFRITQRFVVPHTAVRLISE